MKEAKTETGSNERTFGTFAPGENLRSGGKNRLTNAFTFAILCVSKEAYKLKCMVPLHRTPQTDPKGEDEAE